MRVLHTAPNQCARVFATGSGKPFQPGRMRHAVIIEKCQQIGRGRVSTPIPISRDAEIRAGQMHKSQPMGKRRHDIDHRSVGCVQQHNFELILRQCLQRQRFEAAPQRSRTVERHHDHAESATLHAWCVRRW